MPHEDCAHKRSLGVAKENSSVLSVTLKRLLEGGTVVADSTSTCSLVSLKRLLEGGTVVADSADEPGIADG